MEDGVEAGEVELVLGEILPPQLEPAGVLLLEGRVVVVGEAVDPDHLVAGGLQRLREVRADEPGRAGDQVPHARTGY